MEILRVFNNNLVLARDPGGDEVILTGRGLGFQARPGQVVDPAKVVRAALQDAASVAGLLVTTEAMVADAPKKESAGGGMPGGGMGGGMGGMDF